MLKVINVRTFHCLIRIVGFEELTLSQSDNFTTEHLEKRLARSGVIETQKEKERKKKMKAKEDEDEEGDSD